MKRHKLGHGKSRKNFKKGTRTHKKNLQGNPMRGGIRL